MGDGNPGVHSFALNTFGHFVCRAAIVALVNKVLKFVALSLPHSHSPTLSLSPTWPGAMMGKIAKFEFAFR